MFLLKLVLSLGVIFTPFPSYPCPGSFGRDIFGCHNGWGLLLASGKSGPEMLLNFLQCTGQPHSGELSEPKLSLGRLRSPVLQCVTLSPQVPPVAPSFDKTPDP